MVFPSLMFQIDQGAVAQLSAWAVVGFSFILYRFKKIVITSLAVLALVIILQGKVFAFGMAPSMNMSGCMSYNYCANNMNYYGQSWGSVPPAYFYPQLPYHSFWPQNNYFMPHSPSPYQSFDCPFCGQQMYQQQSFPSMYQHPGGGAS